MSNEIKPMSDLPLDKDAVLLIESRSNYPCGKWYKSFVIGSKWSSTGKVEIDEPATIEYSANYWEGECKFLGWLYLLPNPNDIK